MKLTRKQSIALALAILIIFFIISIALVDDDTNRGITDLNTPPNDSSRSKNGSNAPTPSLSEGEQTGPALTLNRFHRAETKDGKKLWEISASSGSYLPEDRSALVKDANLIFFQKDGKVIELEAEQAKLVIEEANLNKAEIEGNVKVIFDKKVELTTEQAVYDRISNKVMAPGLVKIQSDMIDITGEELEADLNGQQFMLKKEVSSVIKPRKD